MAKIDLLSAAKVRTLKAPGDYLDGRGLYLQVRSQSSKSWLLKYSIEKRAREMGLGPAADIPLTTARELRDRHRALLKQGVDPLEHKKAEKSAKALERAKTITFKDACARYRCEPLGLEKHQARRPVGSDAQGLCLSDHRRPARAGDRRRPRHGRA